jgi:hypothetical protein
MHELFASVLAKRDLSRAGELFSLSDDKIVDSLTDVVSKYRSPTQLIFKHVSSLAAGDFEDRVAPSILGEHERSVGDRDLCQQMYVLHSRD